MLFEGEIDDRIKENTAKKGKLKIRKKDILKIKIETNQYEYEIDLSYGRKYIFFLSLLLIMTFLIYDWVKLRLESRKFDVIYSAFYEDNADELVLKLSDLVREVDKLKELNRALLSLVFGENSEYSEIVSVNINFEEDDHIIKNLSVVSEGLKMIYEELMKEKELHEHLPTLWPVRGRITSGFGYRLNPVSEEHQFHSGIDISASMGTPVLASASGRVVEVGRNHLNGLYIRIRHINNICTIYAHLSRVFVKRGDYVKKGEIIGLVGSTGRATGEHLHFEISYKGRPVDPLMFLVQE